MIGRIYHVFKKVCSGIEGKILIIWKIIIETLNYLWKKERLKELKKSENSIQNTEERMI